MAEKVCAYKDAAKSVLPAFDCPQECDGGLTFKVPHYFVGKAREKYGPDMLLCKAHGEWYAKIHPGWTKRYYESINAKPKIRRVK
jgi:hypothetical protein